MKNIFENAMPEFLLVITPIMSKRIKRGKPVPGGVIDVLFNTFLYFYGPLSLGLDEDYVLESFFDVSFKIAGILNVKINNYLDEFEEFLDALIIRYYK